MKVSHSWLQTYFDTPLPSSEKVVEKLMFHSFEVEGVEQVSGDSVIDIDVLPNRAHDCLSHRGIAKELSVLFEIPLARDVLREDEPELPKSKLLSVEIEDPLLCRRYTAAVLRGVKVGPSPEWLKARLEALGQRSINNIVDATNYVMFGLGQPLHAFDLNKLKIESGKWKVNVRSAKEGERITTLTNDEYELTPENLLIVDGNNDTPIGIAGIKGGKVAEVDADTTDIVLESANFNPAHARKSSQLLKLRTDASTRFENELAPEYASYGLQEAVTLILDIVGGEIEGSVDVFPRRRNISYMAGVSTPEINALLGTQIQDSDVESIFNRFGFVFKKVVPVDELITVAKSLEGVPYTYGASILYDAPHTFDCSSFVSYAFSRAGVRVPRTAIDQYAYGREVSADELKPGDVIFSIQKDAHATESFLRVADGTEVTVPAVKYTTFEYMPGTEVACGVSHCGIYLGDDMVIHAAGKSSAGKVVIETLSNNKNFANVVGYRRMTEGAERYVVEVPFERLDVRIKEDLIEEIGRVYGYENISETPVEKGTQEVYVDKNFYYAEKVRELLTKKGFTEVYTYSMLAEGDVEIENPIAEDKKSLRKTLAIGLSRALELNTKNAPLFGVADVRIFEIGKVFKDEREHTALGIVATKESDVTETVKMLSEEFTQLKGGQSGGVYECNLDVVIENLPLPKEYDVLIEPKQIVCKPFSVYPFALRDIAVWVPEELEASIVRGIITDAAGGLLVRADLFDEFKKEGRVSYAFRLVFQAPDRTLSEEDIATAMERITAALGSQDKFEVR